MITIKNVFVFDILQYVKRCKTYKECNTESKRYTWSKWQMNYCSQ